MAGIGAIENLMDKLEAQQKHRFGTTRYVNSSTGMDVSSGTHGLTPSNPFKTIAAAVAMSAAGDTIKCKGSFSEAVTVAVDGLSIIGVGNGPKECQWTADADEVCLLISGCDYVHVENIYFRPPAYSAGTPAAIQLADAQWTTIKGCRFQGKTASHRAIYSANANSDNTHIKDCEFFYMNTATHGAAIKLTDDAAGSAYSGWVIENCVFSSCVTAIDFPARCCVIRDCAIAEVGSNASSALAAVLALGIGLDGTGSGGNIVTRNLLGGAYSATLYKVGDASGAADYWAGNFNVLTGGVTAANPA